MLSCKEASIVVSQSLDRELSLREKLGLKAHLLMCSACQQMAKQMRILQTLAQNYEASEENDSDHEQTQLPEEACDRIMKQLKNAMHDHSKHE